MAIIARTLARIKADPLALLGGAVAINDHFARAGHVWRERALDPATTLCLFVRQILAGNAAITHVRHLAQLPFAASSYCEARQRLPLEAIAGLVERVSCDCIKSIRSICDDAGATIPTIPPPSFCGRRVHLADATTVTTPDTPPLQDLWPQPSTQRVGCGFPMIKLLGLLDLATGIVLHLTMMCLHCHEMSQLAGMHAVLRPGDVLLGDRGFCSFTHLFSLVQMRVDAVFRMHQRQIVDFTPHRRARPKGRGRRGYKRDVPSSHFVRKLGHEDQIVQWIKPRNRPTWMSVAQYAMLPATLLVREIAYHIVEPGRRVRRVVIATTLLDATRYPKQQIARLYGLRWQVETNFRHLKQTMRMDQLKCHSADGVMKELLIYVLVYNLVRSAMALAATRQGVTVDRISFGDALRWLNCCCCCCCRRDQRWVPQLVVNPVRPGRWCPRVKKRRMKEYDFMMRPRHAYSQPSASETVED